MFKTLVISNQNKFQEFFEKRSEKFNLDLDVLNLDLIECEKHFKAYADFYDVIVINLNSKLNKKKTIRRCLVLKNHFQRKAVLMFTTIRIRIENLIQALDNNADYFIHNNLYQVDAYFKAALRRLSFKTDIKINEDTVFNPKKSTITYKHHTLKLSDNEKFFMELFCKNKFYLSETLFLNYFFTHLQGQDLEKVFNKFIKKFRLKLLKFTGSKCIKKIKKNHKMYFIWVA